MLKLHRIDFDGADFTYGQRIALGEIFSSTDTTEYDRMKKAFRELHGFSARWLPVGARTKAFTRIAEGLTAWVEKERELLKYDPTPDELNAGIKELGEKVGSMSTIKALAKAYGKDPDEVVGWEYSKVFGILWTDLEERKYETKLMKLANGRNHAVVSGH